jgi:hypothetical protein
VHLIGHLVEYIYYQDVWNHDHQIQALLPFHINKTLLIKQYFHTFHLKLSFFSQNNWSPWNSVISQMWVLFTQLPFISQCTFICE